MMELTYYTKETAPDWRWDSPAGRAARARLRPKIEAARRRGWKLRVNEGLQPTRITFGGSMSDAEIRAECERAQAAWARVKLYPAEWFKKEKLGREAEQKRARALPARYLEAMGESRGADGLWTCGCDTFSNGSLRSACAHHAPLLDWDAYAEFEDSGRR